MEGRKALCSAVLFCGAFLGNAQNQTPAPSPAPPQTPTSPVSIPDNPRRTPTSTTPSQQPDFNRPTNDAAIFLSGKVVLSDGSPLPDSVAIERICGTRVFREAMTDRKGHFSFQVGRDLSLFMDAQSSDSELGRIRNTGRGLNAAPLAGCELRASLPGFQSSVVDLSTRRAMENPDIGIIVMRRLAQVEGLTVSATSLNAPKNARKAFEKGHELLLKSKLEDARTQLEKAVAEYPKYAAAWYDLGLIRSRGGDSAGARTAFTESMTADPKYLNPYDGLAQIAVREKKWQEAADLSGRMLELNRFDFPRAFFVHGLAMLNLGNLEEAEKSAKNLLEVDKTHSMPRGEQLMGVILAQKGELTLAAEHLKRFVELAPESAEAETARGQLRQIEKSLTSQNK